MDHPISWKIVFGLSIALLLFGIMSILCISHSQLAVLGTWVLLINVQSYVVEEFFCLIEQCSLNCF